jgi:hypothetical protein
VRKKPSKAVKQIKHDLKNVDLYDKTPAQRMDKLRRAIERRLRK